MLSLTQKIARNFILQIVGRILALVLGLFVIGLLMRYLGPRQYGYYSIAVAFLQIFGIIADFGLYLMTLRYLGEADVLRGEERERRVRYIMGNIFTLRFFSALVFYGGAFIISLAFPYPQLVKLAVGVLSGSFFFCTLIQALAAFYQKILRTEKIVIGEVLGKLIMLGAIILFIKLNSGFYFVLSIYVLGNFANFLLLFLVAKKWVFLKFRFDFSLWKKILKDAWPIGLAICFNVIYFKSDTLILSFYHSPEDVGLYGACYRVLEVLITIPPLFIGLILPQLTRAWKAGEFFRFKQLFQKSFDFLVMLALPIIFGTIVLAPRIMVLIGGARFSISGDILKIVIIACGVLFIGELFKHTAVALGKQRQILPLYLVTAVLALVGYFIFIPRYSYWGAAWMTLGAECLMFGFAYFTVRRTTKISLSLKFFLRSLASSLVMIFPLLALNAWNLFSLIVVAIVIYFGTLYLLKGISGETIKEVLILSERR